MARSQPVRADLLKSEHHRARASDRDALLNAPRAAELPRRNQAASGLPTYFLVTTPRLLRDAPATAIPSLPLADDTCASFPPCRTTRPPA
ncbi:hypothetical protein [Streptomyces albicerus]|uniref:hypothetical protein n=1 Tax=Streptomyces albicerus TaxID=2569859 RepID=UPI00124B9D9C|nr:hypothetical protein [Streptomyces albicerus]